ncbi:hypothetical protein JCM8202v2_001588 [Rhodotorula sphaerocarpa]
MSARGSRMGGAQKSPDAALILRLPQEVLDTICAFIRDDDRSDDEEVTLTLCSLARTARCFRWPAQRALLYDPTRGLIGRNAGDRTEMFLEWILSNPSLGLHVRRLDHLATLSEYIAYDEFGPLVSPRQFSIYVLALAQITPNLVSIKVDPFRPEITSCFQHLARQSHLQEIHLASFPPEDREEDVGFVCWSFLAGLERSRIHSLALPFFDDAFAVPADAPRALAFEV